MVRLVAPKLSLRLTARSRIWNRVVPVTLHIRGHTEFLFLDKSFTINQLRLSIVRWHARCIRERTKQPDAMNTRTTNPILPSCRVPEVPVGLRESTYALLVRSEEKERGVFEMIAYALLLTCALTSMWQLARQPITLPVQLGGVSAHIAHAKPGAQRSAEQI